MKKSTHRWLSDWEIKYHFWETKRNRHVKTFTPTGHRLASCLTGFFKGKTTLLSSRDGISARGVSLLVGDVTDSLKGSIHIGHVMVHTRGYRTIMSTGQKNGGAVSDLACVD